MDPQSIPHASASILRFLPSYEDVNVPYSLRLPTYRSSYMRRYHPYPRYYTPTDQYDTDADADEPLDLSILEVPTIVNPAAPDAVQNVNNVQEQANAAQELQEGNEDIADPGIAYANPGPQDEDENKTGPFLRVDVVKG